MRQMARILIRDGGANFAHAGVQADGYKKLAHIPDEGGEALRLFCILLVVLQKLVIFLEGRTAPAGVCKNGVVATIKDSLGVPASLAASRFAHSRMDGQCAAARLTRRDGDFATIRL